MTTLQDLTAAAETEWLAHWVAGPTEDEGFLVQPGSPAVDLVLADHTGRDRRLSEFWAGGPALLMFWRHFGCGSGRSSESFPKRPKSSGAIRAISA